MDLESWTCSLRSFVSGWSFGPPYTGLNNEWEVLHTICGQAEKGRWMLLPMTGALVLMMVFAFVAFLAVGRKDGYARVGEQENGFGFGGQGETEPNSEEHGDGGGSVEEGRVRLE